MAVDARQRREALDPRRSFLVDAPAGSGKTELLIQRYLTLLARVRVPEAVVAITFTVKAAAEMRTRIVDALRAAKGPRPAEAHQALTWELAGAVLECDAAQGWDLLEHPRRMRVDTIDALCASLTRQMPLLSRFGAQPSVEEHAEELYREAARRTILNTLQDRPQCQPALEKLLRHLDNDVSRLETLLVSMLPKREQWLRHILETPERAVLQSGLQSMIRDGLRRVKEALPAEEHAILAALAQFAAANLDPALPGSGSHIGRSAGPPQLPGCEPQDTAAWLHIANILITSGKTWRRSWTVECGFPRGRKSEKELCKALVARLNGREDLRKALAEVRRLPPSCYSDEQWEILEALCTLLPVAAAQLRLVFRDRATVDFAEIARGALTALGGPENPTDLALALDYRIQHLLVDEFQDTSQTQFELLERLTAGWEPGDGRTLFVVGDPMQSIYRFREAEVGLFLRARRSGIGSVRLEPLRLEVNFRSERAIVEWVNQAFAGIFPRQEEIATGAVAYTPSRAAREQEAERAVRIHPFFGRDDLEEARLVVSLVREASQQDASATTAILVRARTHLPVILRQLQEAGLRYRAIEIDQLGERPVIQDLLALTRALLHPADRIAWLAVLRAPWCGLELRDLHALSLSDERRPVWELMVEESRLAAMSPAGRVRTERIRAVLEKSLKRSRRLPLRRWIEGAWIALGGPACLQSPGDWEDAQTFLSLLEQVEEGGEPGDLHLLTDRVNELFAASDRNAGDALQVMTIHKAKGLEFDTVILPGLGRKTQLDAAELLTWLEAPDSEGISRLLLAPVNGRGNHEDAIIRYISHRDHEKARHEACRLLYVAATRARRQLHLIGYANVLEKDGALELGAPEADSLLLRLWPAVKSEFERRFQERAAPAANAAADPPRAPAVIRRLPAEWQVPEHASAVQWEGQVEAEVEAGAAAGASFVWVGDSLRHVGTVVHRMLRRIAEEGLVRWTPMALGAARPLFRAALASLGVPPGEIPQAAETVERALARTLADERGRWILSGWPEARCECDVSGFAGGRLLRGIIDRTFIDAEGIRWIVDYKTGMHEGSGLEEFLDQERRRYTEQLEGYAALFARLEERSIRLGLYFPLLSGWREWQPQLPIQAAVSGL